MKFSGMVGFWVGDKKTAPDVWKPNVIERPYTGEVMSNFRRWNQTDHMNDELKVNNKISILSDLYAQRNWSSIKYIIWNGAKLKVTGVEVGYPRLILEIGGEYNGENA